MLKKLLFTFLLISLTSLYTHSIASSTASDVIIIRIYHPLSGSATGLIKIYKNNEAPIQIGLPPTTDLDENNAFELIRATINKYTQEGYAIVSSTEFTQTGSTKVYTTYILEKK